MRDVCFQDTLQVAAKLTLASLPKGHVVAEHFEMLSEANKSSRTKAIERREEDLVKVHWNFVNPKDEFCHIL